MKELNKKLAVIQTKLKTKKTSYNSFGKYYLRKAEDILEAVKPFLLEQGFSVTINEHIIATDPVPMLESTAIISDGENQIKTSAIVGVDLKQKGMQTAQQFGAASSYGKKYALGNLFLIDDTQDADSSNKHDKGPVISKLKTSMTKDQFDKAKKYMAAGGELDAIKNKYKLTAVQEKELNGKQTKTENTKETK